MLVVNPAFLCFLTRREPGERSGRDIIGDDRAARNPSIVANLDGRIEDIVDAGPDGVADLRPGLREALLVLEIGGDAPGADVRVLADLGVPDVGEMRHLRA